MQRYLNDELKLTQETVANSNQSSPLFWRIIDCKSSIRSIMYLPSLNKSSKSLSDYA